MRRFCRSHLLCIWCCAILLVFSYVLFDLLDIDGSNFERSPGSCTAAEERVACEEGGRHVALERSAAWLLPRNDPWATIPSASTPTIRVPRPFLLHGRPRAVLSAQGTASTQPDSDPAGSVADL